MIAVSRRTADFVALRPVSWLTIVALFSVVGLVTSLLFARYGIGI
jgi:hypothetical protein